MACVGHCNNHGYSKGTMSRGAVCPGHRPQNSQGTLGSIAGISVPVATGAIITAQFLNDLRSYIASEIDWWNNHADYAGKNASLFTDLRTVGQRVNAQHLNDRQLFMEQMMGDIQVYKDERINSATIPAGQADNNTFPPLPWMMHNKVIGNIITIADINELVNELNNMRLDCVCNADCNCNNVCACHGNCGCNYSDRNLKMEIYYC